jgi:hypothetical protein
MARYTTSIHIAAPPEAVFDFHADPRNIVKVAAPPVQASLLEPYDVPLRLGSLVRLRVVMLGLLPQLWESEIVLCNRPTSSPTSSAAAPSAAGITATSSAPPKTAAPSSPTTSSTNSPPPSPSASWARRP